MGDPLEPSTSPVTASGRPRPQLFRALGKDEPPPEITVNGAKYRRERVFKHDSWAATALYVGARKKIVCKFNRRQPIGWLPMAWLGRWLARREAAMLARLADSPAVPAGNAPVTLGCQRLWNAVAHDYIEGHPLGEFEQVDSLFFPRLHRLLQVMHQRRMAYIDLHKRENIIVGVDGAPHLVDFQISVVFPARWPATAWLARSFLRVLQQTDEYHLQKHYARCRPDLCGKRSWEVGENPPWWISLHRIVGTPFRRFRRGILTKLGIRKAGGHSHTEHFVEDGLRCEGLDDTHGIAPN